MIAHPVRTSADIDAMKPLEPQAIQPVCQAVSLLVAALGEVPLIGFAGAPFTLASYLVEGGPSRDHARTKAMMLADPTNWHALMSKLTDLTVAFLRGQIDAGVDAIQMFDSWAGTLSLADYRQYVLPHSSRVFAALAEYGVPMTHFGVGTAELLGAMSDALRPATAPCRRGLANIADRCGRAGYGPAPRCRATSIRWCCWRAGRWWSAPHAPSSTTGAAPSTPARPATSSIWATACCRRPIPAC